MSAPPVFTALRPERTLSAPPAPLVPLPTLTVTIPPPGDTGSQESAALLPVLAARATANTDGGHHAATMAATTPGGRYTGTQEERAAICSLRRTRAEDQSPAHALG
jgi:hypothetical protein